MVGAEVDIWYNCDGKRSLLIATNILLGDENL
jgi:hypothetical protein